MSQPKPDVRLTVHRGTRQIGGRCKRWSTRGATERATGLLPASLDRSRPAAILISHPNQDHWGLIDDLPMCRSIWTGSSPAKLFAVIGDIKRQLIARTFQTWNSRTRSFAVGSFTVTPILTDRSAFDAYMLLIEGAGKKIPYTGDFRRHGRNRIPKETFDSTLKPGDAGSTLTCQPLAPN